ncbi:MAG: ribonuclease III [Lachnospiraceae bacterium]|nr:ribonuclease III [Lachnospiraceae bacterium]
MVGDMAALEERIGYTFRDRALYLQALTHSSFAHERRNAQDNERLEFLGDAVLELVSSDFLYRNYPQLAEGAMTKLRASLVCEQTLAHCAQEIDLGANLRLGKGEDQTGGRKRPSVLSDAFEALIGAIYLDGGIKDAAAFVHRAVLTDIDQKCLFHDSKTILQELVQAEGKGALTYRLVSEEGPDHDRSYTVAAWIGETQYGSGTGHSKKAAEQDAAYQTLVQIHKKGVVDVFKEH